MKQATPKTKPCLSPLARDAGWIMAYCECATCTNRRIASKPQTE